jgi:hypothetical protein
MRCFGLFVFVFLSCLSLAYASSAISVTPRQIMITDHGIMVYINANTSAAQLSGGTAFTSLMVTELTP